MITAGSDPSGSSDLAGCDGGPGSLRRRLVWLGVVLFLLLALILPPPALGTPSPALGLSPPRVDAVGLQASPLERPGTPLERGGLLFEAHCVGCHVNGGNIIRRGKTLRLAALERNGLGNPEAIAAVAATGLGRMSGYGERLGEGGPQAVGLWVWQQALAGWPPG